MGDIVIPEAVFEEFLQSFDAKLAREQERFVAKMRADLEAFRARLEAEAAALQREMQAAYEELREAKEEVARLRQLERIRHTYEAERDEGDEGSLLQ